MLASPGKLHSIKTFTVTVDSQTKLTGYTLEPSGDEPGKVVASPGDYEANVYNSKKLGYQVLKLNDVPEGPNIEIHIGSVPKNTTGCILVGAEPKTDFVGKSSDTFHELTLKKRESGYSHTCKIFKF